MKKPNTMELVTSGPNLYLEARTEAVTTLRPLHIRQCHNHPQVSLRTWNTIHCPDAQNAAWNEMSSNKEIHKPGERYNGSQPLRTLQLPQNW